MGAGDIAPSCPDDARTESPRVRRYFTGALKPPFNRAARDAAGVPSAYYEPLACAVSAG